MVVAESQAGAIPVEIELDECAAVGRLDVAGWYASGVLVHPRIVLTVAHTGPCGGKAIPEAVALRVRSLRETARAEVIEGRFTGHEAYTGRGAYDIAAMVLKCHSTVTPVALATAAELAAAAEVVLAGFGADHEAGWIGLSDRRAVTVPIRYAADSSPAEAIRFDPALEFLAGADDCGPCFGDSGGPAYIVVDGERKLAGIISRPAAKRKPFCKGLTILTRVDAFQGWIESQVP